MACVRSKKGRKCRKDEKSNSALLEWWDGEDDQIHRIRMMIVSGENQIHQNHQIHPPTASPPLLITIADEPCTKVDTHNLATTILRFTLRYIHILHQHHVSHTPDDWRAENIAGSYYYARWQSARSGENSFRLGIAIRYTTKTWATQQQLLSLSLTGRKPFQRLVYTGQAVGAAHSHRDDHWRGHR